MARRARQRTSRLTNPVVATMMYESLTTIAKIAENSGSEEIMAIANGVLDFVRDKEEVVDASQED